MHYTIFADGGARGNPGPAGAGAVIKNEQKEVVLSVSHFLGEATNNVAEYTALVLALRALKNYVGEEAHTTNVFVFMDSELVIKQMKGVYKIKHPNLKILASEVSSLASLFHSISYAHIRREQNAEADALANRAMDARA